MPEDRVHLPITCLYCGHRWTESITDLRQQKRTFYRGDERQPSMHIEEYLVQCPHCGRRMVVTVQVRGA